MASGLIYLLQSLVDLYLITFVLRLAMQWVRADFRNPVVQFVLTVTNPIVIPLRRLLPPLYKIDTATLLVYLALQVLVVGLLTQLACADTPGIGSILGLAVIRALRLVLNVYMFLVFGYVLMSWIGQGGYNPSLAMASKLLHELAAPVLGPFQRIIPAIAGLDLSPIFLLLGLGAFTRMLQSPAQQMTEGLLCALGAII
jgi:YggT family protein